MRKTLFLAIIILCCLSAFGQSDLSTINDEEYAIFTVVLGKDREIIVIRDKSDLHETTRASFKRKAKEQFQTLLDETLADFEVKNKKSAQIERKFPTKANYTLLKLEELKELFSFKFDGDMDWDGYYRKYPKSGGIFTLSRVGFSKDGKQALLFVANWCGELCGKGNFYLLKKENSEWKIVGEFMDWIS